MSQARNLSNASLTTWILLSLIISPFGHSPISARLLPTKRSPRPAPFPNTTLSMQTLILPPAGRGCNATHAGARRPTGGRGAGCRCSPN